MSSFRQGGDSLFYLPDKCNSFASMKCVGTSYPAAYLNPASWPYMFNIISFRFGILRLFRYKSVKTIVMPENITCICAVDIKKKKLYEKLNL